MTQTMKSTRVIIFLPLNLYLIFKNTQKLNTYNIIKKKSLYKKKLNKNK
jgi:hypothetical protein